MLKDEIEKVSQWRANHLSWLKRNYEIDCKVVSKGYDKKLEKLAKSLDNAMNRSIKDPNFEYTVWI